MADSYITPPGGDSVHPQPVSGSSGVARQPKPPPTAQTKANKRVGVFDRPEPALVSWSPMTFFVLGLGVLFLLWLFGIFEYLLR